MGETRLTSRGRGLVVAVVAGLLIAGCSPPEPAGTTRVASAASDGIDEDAAWRDIRALWIIDHRRAPKARVVRDGWRREFEKLTAEAERTGCNALVIDGPMCFWTDSDGPNVLRPACRDWALERAPRLADIDGPDGFAAGIELALERLGHVIVYEGSLWSEPGTPSEHAARVRDLYAPLKARFGDRLVVLLDQGGLMPTRANGYNVAHRDEFVRAIGGLWRDGVIDGGELAVHFGHPAFGSEDWWAVVVETGIDNNTRAFARPWGEHPGPKLCLIRPGLDKPEPGKQKLRLGREWIQLASRDGWAIAANTRYWDDDDRWSAIEGR